MSARRTLITRAARELTVHFNMHYGLDDDNIQADIMGIIDSHIGSFLNDIPEDIIPNGED